MEEKIEIKKRIIMENDGNKLILLEDCNLINGVCISKIKELFPKFVNNIKTFNNCYIIELKGGDTLYE